MQQTLALWLNYAAGAVNWYEMVYNVESGENEQFGTLICELEGFIQSGDPALCLKAKNIADFLNNSGFE
jgi:hypothetical protein